MKTLFKTLIVAAAITACFGFTASQSESAFAAQKDPHTAYQNGRVDCYNRNTNDCGVKVAPGTSVN